MREPTDPLLTKARRFLRSAVILGSDGDYDSAASRLYYAMFYCAEALLLSKGLSFSTHRAVIANFGQHFAKTGNLPPEMHQWLREAFDRRQQGDYSHTPLVEERHVQELHVKAQEFVRLTEGYLRTADEGR